MDIFALLLALHILGGGISLLSGAYLLAKPKGTSLHKRIGKLYFYSMLTAAFAAFPMSILHPNYFLFIVAVFTSFMLLSGVRFLRIRTTAAVDRYDWALLGIMLLAAFAFIGFGSYHLFLGNSFGVVFLFFGTIGLLFVRQDRRTFKGENPIRNFYLTTHLQRMIGSYIASTTAFLVVNNKILPPIVAWLLPSIILIPLIRKWTRKYGVNPKNESGETKEPSPFE